MIKNDIEIMLRENIPGAQVIVSSNDQIHFDAIIITDAFKDQKLIERQKLVYAIVGSHITSGAIHALSLKTYTQQEWQNKCGS